MENKIDLYILYILVGATIVYLGSLSDSLMIYIGGLGVKAHGLINLFILFRKDNKK